MKNITFYIIVIFVCVAGLVNAQTFTETATNLPALLVNAESEWADYDNDGDYDLLLAGYKISGDSSNNRLVLYTNNNNSFSSQLIYDFTNEGAFGNLIGLDWQDFDNDGDFDILISIETSGNRGTVKILQNNQGVYEEYQGWTTDVDYKYSYGDARWVDLDNDGDLDILASFDQHLQIFRNDGGYYGEENQFRWQTYIGDSNRGDVKFDIGDYDGDGDLDIVFAANGITIAENIGNLNFNIFNPSYSDSRSAKWIDFDSDGDLDILNSNYELLRNDGANTFTQINVNFDPQTSTWDEIELGDINNDGFLDVYFQGYNNSAYIANYTGVANEFYSGIYDVGYFGQGDVTFIDLDGDTDLDVHVVATNSDNNSPVQKIYTNLLNNVNLAPGAPTGLSAIVSDKSVTLSWNAPTDDVTPSAALSYNIYLTSPSKNLILPAADLSTGRLLKPKFGTYYSTTINLVDLSDEIYSWGVQAIDQGKLSSEFAHGTQFTIGTGTAPNPEITNFYKVDNTTLRTSVGEIFTRRSLSILVNNQYVMLEGTGFSSITKDNLLLVNNKATEIEYSFENLLLFKLPEGVSGSLDVTVTTNGKMSNSKEIVINQDLAWSQHISNISTSDIEDIEYISDRKYILVSGMNAQITENDGITWSNLNVPANTGLKFVKKIDSDTIYIGGNDGKLLKSIDKGVSWNSVNLGAVTSNLNDMHIMHNMTIVGDGIIIRCDNTQGTSWASTSYPGQVFTKVTSGDYYRDVVVGTSDGKLLLEKNSWSPTQVSASNSQIVDIAIYFDQIYVITNENGRFYYSENDGNSFINRSLPTGVNLNGIQTNWGRGNVFGAGTDGKVGYFNNVEFIQMTSETTSSLGKMVFGDFSGLILNDKSDSDNGATLLTLQEKNYPFANSVSFIDKQLPLDTLEYIGTGMDKGTGTDGEFYFNNHNIDLGQGFFADYQIFDRTENSLKVRFNVPLPSGRYDTSFGNNRRHFSQNHLIISVAPIFTNTLNVEARAIVFGDFDSDRDLDVVISNFSNNLIAYENQNGLLSPTNAFVDDWCCGPISVLEYINIDNADDQELFMAGLNKDGNQDSRLLLRGTNNLFTNINFNIGGWSASWSLGTGDFDADGDEDFTTTPWQAYSGGTWGSRVWQNNGSSLKDTCCPYTEMYDGETIFADLNNDGIQEAITAGISTYGTNVVSANEATLLISSYTGQDENDNPKFENKTELRGLRFGAVDAGDYDNDGDLDLVVSGRENDYSAVNLYIYRNDGNFFFAEVYQTTGLEFGKVKWIDFNNDGRLDIILSGSDNDGQRKVLLLQNNGNNNFEPLEQTGMPNIAVNGEIRFVAGDLDADGYIDLGVSTIDTENSYGLYAPSTTFKNIFSPNTPPTAPAGISFLPNGKDGNLTISWNQSADAQQSGGLTYNLRIGSTSGAGNIKEAYLRNERGNVELGTSWTLNKIAAGDYWVQVQAVDHGYLHSEFSAPVKFTVSSDPDLISQVVATHKQYKPGANNTFAQGELIDVKSIASNSGLSEISGDFTSRLYFSPTQTISPSSILLTESSVLANDINLTFNAEQSVEFQIDPTLAVGTYYFIFETDINNTVPEADESNNISALPVSIIADNIKPIILNFALNGSYNFAQDIPIEFIVEENVELASAKVYFKRSEYDYSTLMSADLDPVLRPEKIVGTVQTDTILTDVGLDIFVSATDNSGNVSYSDTLSISVIADLQKPSISNIDYPLYHIDNDSTITAIVTDNSKLRTVNIFVKGLDEDDSKFVSSDMVQSGNTFEYTFSGRNWSTINNRVEFYIEALDFANNMETSARYSISDSSSPTINPPVYPNTYFSTQGFDINVGITDQSAVSQILFYAKGVNESDSKWKEKNIPISSTQNYTISSADIGITSYEGLMFYFYAVDLQGNESQTENFAIAKQNESSLSIQINEGREVEDYQAISFPLELSQKDVASLIVDVIGEYKKNKWRMFWYNNGKFVEYLDGFDAVQPGEGYFILSKESGTVTFSGGKSVTNHNFEIRAGWTLIGNPYTYNVNWNNVKAGINGISDLYYVEDGSASTTTVMEPFKAYFVSSSTIQSINYSGESASGRFGEDVEKWEGSNWLLSMGVKKGAFTNALLGVGMHENASNGFDQLDRINLPRFLKYIDTEVNQKSHLGHAFARDIVPVQENGYWELNVESNVEGAYSELFWKFPENVTKGIVLVDRKEQQVLDLSKTISYRFKGSGSNRFVILYGDKEYLDRMLANELVSIGPLYPNPVRQNIFMPISIPNAGTSLKVDLVDLQGRNLGTLFDDNIEKGLLELQLNISNLKQLNSLKGIYILDIKVESKDITNRFTKKIVFENE